MKRFALYLSVGAGALAVAAAVVLMQRAQEREPAAPIGGAPVAAAPESSPEPAASVPGTPRQVRPRPAAANAGGAPQANQPPEQTRLPLWPGSELTADEYTMSKMDIFHALQSETREWTIEHYAQKAARRERLSGREAYQVYTYLRSCMNQPRSVEALESRTERARSSERLAQRTGPDGVDAVARRLRASFVRCENLPSDDALALIMLDWLTLAAERGFAQAQLAYYRSARWLLQIDEWTPYRHPERVYEYRRLAPLFLEAAVQAGHADAFAEYAQALAEEVIFEADPQAAYAYAVAADLAQGGAHEDARDTMQWLEIELSPDAIRDARRDGRELCRRYCRNR